MVVENTVNTVWSDNADVDKAALRSLMNDLVDEANSAGAPFADRAAFMAATLPAATIRASWLANGRTYSVVRTTGGPIVQDDGTEWAPDGDIFVGHFGAVGDRVADDGPAIQAAFDFAQRSAGHTVAPGRTVRNLPVYLGLGHFRVASPVRTSTGGNSGIRLIGLPGVAATQGSSSPCASSIWIDGGYIEFRNTFCCCEDFGLYSMGTGNPLGIKYATTAVGGVAWLKRVHLDLYQSDGADADVLPDDTFTTGAVVFEGPPNYFTVEDCTGYGNPALYIGWVPGTSVKSTGLHIKVGNLKANAPGKSIVEFADGVQMEELRITDVTMDMQSGATSGSAIDMSQIGDGFVETVLIDSLECDLRNSASTARAGYFKNVRMLKARGLNMNGQASTVSSFYFENCSKVHIETAWASSFNNYLFDGVNSYIRLGAIDVPSHNVTDIIQPGSRLSFVDYDDGGNEGTNFALQLERGFLDEATPHLVEPDTNRNITLYVAVPNAGPARSFKPDGTRFRIHVRNSLGSAMGSIALHTGGGGPTFAATTAITSPADGETLVLEFEVRNGKAVEIGGGNMRTTYQH